MKQTFYIASLFTALLVLFGACSKDKGNYTYTALDKVTIDVTGLDLSYSRLRFQNLNIKPVVKYRGETVNPDAPQFKELSFTWEMYPTSTTSVQEKHIIGNTLPLNAEMSQKETNWQVLFTVTNINTGVKEFAKFTVAITPNLAEGWMLLYEKNGATDVGMIVNNEISKTSIASDRVLYDLYSISNSGPLQGAPGSIIASYATGITGLKVYIQSAGDVVSVNPTSFQKIDDFSTLFWIKPLVKAPQLVKATEKRKEFVINNNKLHIIDYVTIGTGRRAFGNALSGNYGTLAPWVSSTTTAFDAVVYDQTNKKFMKVVANGTEVTAITTTQVPAAIGFDANNVGLEFEMADLGFSTNANSGWENMIMKDATGKRYLMIADFKAGEIATIGKEKYEMPISRCPEIDAINSITASMSSRVFYYSSPNNLYQFEYTSGNTSLRWTPPNGEKITNISLQKHYNTNPALGTVLYNPKNFCKILYIATYDETNKVGSVYQMEINITSGIITPGTEKKYTGFGKIKAMAWKPFFII